MRPGNRAGLLSEIKIKEK